MIDGQISLATFGGGCFWCTEAIFRRIKGVEKITSGYAGGRMKNPTYEDVTSGETGHAEAVQIEYDSKVISYHRLLEIFFATHDPTQLNRQGNDIGTQYRSVIFYHDEAQKQDAVKMIKDLEKSGEYSSHVVTRVLPYEEFYTAEAYHQKYYENYRNSNPYCSIVIDPKINKLLRKFEKDVKKEYLGNL